MPGFMDLRKPNPWDTILQQAATMAMQNQFQRKAQERQDQQRKMEQDKMESSQFFMQGFVPAEAEDKDTFAGPSGRRYKPDTPKIMKMPGTEAVMLRFGGQFRVFQDQKQAESAVEQINKIKANVLAGMPPDEQKAALYPGTQKESTPTATQKDYEYAVERGYKGTFAEFRKNPTVQISLGDKVKEQTAKDIAKQQTYIKTPAFSADAITRAKTMHGIEWASLEPAQKNKAIYNNMSNDIKQYYPNAVFGEMNGVVGWYDGETLIRAWADPLK